jgi:hypothetical protein
MEPVTAASPRFKARAAGCFYLLTIVAGLYGLVFDSGRPIAISVAGLSYVVVTLLFYALFKPVNSSLSLLAALFSFAGIAVGPLSRFPNPLVFFGIYCLLIGYLIFRSTFLPRALGVLMAFGGLGWLTYLSPSLARSLYPFNLAPGLLGEGSLTLWLLVNGVNVPAWEEQASSASLHARRQSA